MIAPGELDKPNNDFELLIIPTVNHPAMAELSRPAAARQGTPPEYQMKPYH